MSKTGADIDGIPLAISPAVGWSFQTGVRPVMRTFGVQPKHVERLTKKVRKPVTLSITSNGTRAVFRHLWVLSVLPGANKEEPQVLVSDLRWLWAYKHIRRCFNMRRTVGTRIIAKDGDQGRIDLAPDVQYADFSLNPEGGLWSCVEMLTLGKVGFKYERRPRGILDALASFVGEHSGRTPPIRISPAVTKLYGRTGAFGRDPYLIENVEIDDPGDGAVLRVLANMPTADIWVDDFGAIRVYSKSSGDENAEIESLGHESVGKGHIAVVDMRLQRPKEVHCLYTPECEIRLDAIETESSATAASGARVIRPWGMKNVLLSPDPELVIQPGDEGGRRVVTAGNWITVKEALRSWGRPPGWLKDLEFKDILRAMIPGKNLFAALYIMGRLNMRSGDTLWVARLNSLMTHFRKTYQINSEIMRSIYALNAHRVAVLDQATGAQARAGLFMNYSYCPSGRNYFDKNPNAPQRAWFINVDGYPAGAQVPGLIPGALAIQPNIVAIEAAGGMAAQQGTIQCSGLVQIVDHDQGIIRIEPGGDPYGAIGQCMPSKVKSQERCAVLMRDQRLKPVTYNSIHQTSDILQLTEEHKVCVILTAIPGAPNSEFGLVRQIIKPTDVFRLLPPQAAFSLAQCNGPVKEIRVPPTIQTAKVGWSDSLAVQIIKGVFGFNTDRGYEPGFLADIRAKEGIMNWDRSRLGSASLKTLSLAYAAQEYSRLADRSVGAAEGHLNAAIELAGWIDRVVHTLEPSGSAQTTISLPEHISGISPMALLPAYARGIILRQVKRPE